MTQPFIIPSDLIVNGNAYLAGTLQRQVLRSELAIEESKVYPVPWEAWRVWDAFQTNLPGTSASDDLGLYGGTVGTNCPAIKSYDVKSAGAITLKARAAVMLPAEYQAGQSLKIRASAGMVTTLSDGAATIDFSAYKSDRQGGAGSDLVSTPATSIKSLTLSDKDFVLTATSLSAGDWLDILMTMAITDAAGATAVIGIVGAVELVMSIKG